VSAECRAMLSGLMDVRIPLRLGNMNRFTDFSNHPWLAAHPPPPVPLIAPNIHEMRTHLSLKFCHLQLKSFSSVEETVTLPSRAQEILSNF
jgi:hypothetical protein